MNLFDQNTFETSMFLSNPQTHSNAMTCVIGNNEVFYYVTPSTQSTQFVYNREDSMLNISIFDWD